MTPAQQEYTRKEIGKEITLRRQYLKLSVRELAERVGMSETTIRSAEEGKFWLGMKQWLMICDGLQMEGLAVEWKNI